MDEDNYVPWWRSSPNPYYREPVAVEPAPDVVAEPISVEKPAVDDPIDSEATVTKDPV